MYFLTKDLQMTSRLYNLIGSASIWVVIPSPFHPAVQHLGS